MQHMTDAPVTLQLGSLLKKHLTITGIPYVGERKRNPKSEKQIKRTKETYLLSYHSGYHLFCPDNKCNCVSDVEERTSNAC